MDYGWTLDAEVWRKLRESFLTNQWSRVYVEELYSNQVSQSSGLYIIVSALKLVVQNEPMNGFRNAIYVGQSRNLRTRFVQHVKGYGNVTKAKETFRRLEFWWTLMDQEQLSSHEQLLIYALGPSANKVNVIKATSIKAHIGTPRSL